MFETFNPAVPLYDYSKPYQQIVFQYSLHILDKPGRRLQHNEFLAQPTGYPRIKMIEQLIGETDEQKIDTIRQNLLEYSKLDTLAMVEILKVLEREIKSLL